MPANSSAGLWYGAVRLTEADVMCSANAACCEKEAGVWNTHNVLNAYPLPLLLRRPTHHSQAARRHQRLPWPMGHIMNALSTSRAMMGLWPLEMQNQWLQRNLQTNILTTRFCLFQNEFCICFLFVCLPKHPKISVNCYTSTKGRQDRCLWPVL